VRVIVVGGGIAGLSAAIALRKTGHEAVVLERAPRIDPAGAGLTLFANAMRALERLGVAEAVAARGAAATRSAILTWQGRELTRVPADLLKGAIALHRADLQAELAAASGEVRLGVEVTAVEQSESGVVARSTDGSEERADLLVGADGLNSVVRGAIADVPIRYAGYTAWRVSSVPVEGGRLTESWGVGERFGLVDGEPGAERRPGDDLDEGGWCGDDERAAGCGDQARVLPRGRPRAHATAREDIRSSLGHSRSGATRV
jgi:FAD-dependent urate hydroxylase